MPSIINPELTITTDRPADRAAVRVRCDLHFTEVEVNAMNLLGLTYTLSSRILNEYVLDDDPVVVYESQTFPRVPRAARAHEEALFYTYVPMENLHERLLGKDKLIGELTLRNDETGEETVRRTDELAIDLAA